MCELGEECGRCVGGEGGVWLQSSYISVSLILGGLSMVMGACGWPPLVLSASSCSCKAALSSSLQGVGRRDEGMGRRRCRDEDMGGRR